MSISRQLNDSEIQDIQRLLEMPSLSLSGLMSALAIAESSRATGADLALLFPDSVRSAALSNADGLHYDGANDISCGVLSSDIEEVRRGEEQLAESLRWYAALSGMIRLERLANEFGGTELRGRLIDLMEIPAGDFHMSSPSDEPTRSEETDQESVELTRLFWIGRTFVTQRQWQDVMGSEPWLLGGACCVDEGDVVQVEFDTDLDVRRGDDLPAVFIIWDLASLFCEMLTRLERAAGLISESQQYRLPTEAEWEYACHFGSTTARSSDDDVNGSGDEEWFGEWCADWYSEEREAGVNPGGPELGFQRVVRSRTAHREGIEPWLRDGHLLNIGFRVVLSSGEVAR